MVYFDLKHFINLLGEIEAETETDWDVGDQNH